MKNALRLSILVLSLISLACSSSSDTAYNGDSPAIKWITPAIGTKLVFSDTTTDSVNSKVDATELPFEYKRVFTAGGKTVVQLQYGSTPIYIIYEPNGDLTMNGDSLGRMASTYTMSSATSYTRVVKDSVSFGDTTSYTKVHAYRGLEYVRRLGVLTLLPHTLDSNYTIFHANGYNDTIISSHNFWFDSEHGGYYSKYTQLIWQSQNGYRTEQFEKTDLIDYKP